MLIFFFSLKSNPREVDWKQCASIGFLTIPFEFLHYSCHDVNCVYYFFSLAWMHESVAAVAPNKPDKKKISQHRTADTFDGSSYLTCKTLMFHPGRVSSIPNADGADSKAARLAAEALQMLCIFQMITDARTAAKTDRCDVEQRHAWPFCAALC